MHWAQLCFQVLSRLSKYTPETNQIISETTQEWQAKECVPAEPGLLRNQPEGPVWYIIGRPTEQHAHGSPLAVGSCCEGVVPDTAAGRVGANLAGWDGGAAVPADAMLADEYSDGLLPSLPALAAAGGAAELPCTKVPLSADVTMATASATEAGLAAAAGAAADSIAGLLNAS